MELVIISGPNYAVSKRGWKHHAYRIRIWNGAKALTVPWQQGLAYTKDPELADVLEGLCSDASAGEMDFEDFCAEFGYDTDSRKAEAIWKECRKVARGLAYLGIGC